jgi:hypothetical protein
MRIKGFLSLISLVLLSQSAFAQKKTSVIVGYDKLGDMTCGSVLVGNVAPGLEGDKVLLDGSYCSKGKTLQPPTTITLRLLAKAWLAASGPQITFLLDGADRLTFETQFNYAAERPLRVGQITFKVTPAELEKITAAKVAEFQVFGHACKLKQKELAQLNALAQSGSSPSP